jgi:endonuclease YncB( thermonuclease family)
MPRFIDWLRRRRSADDQALLTGIIDRHDKASGASAQRGRSVSRVERRPAVVGGDRRVGWMRPVVLISIFVGLVIYVALEQPRIPGVSRGVQRPSELDSEFVGTIRVVDGDTVSMREQRLRLAGIDAPEKDQTCTRGGKIWSCGEQSSAALKAWIGGSMLTCLGNTIDKYRRPVVRCTARGFDVAAWSVENGWSVAGPIGPPDYKSQEAQARSLRLGLWSGEFIPPWEWRAAHGVDNQ